jgi:hypothetical protein
MTMRRRQAVRVVKRADRPEVMTTPGETESERAGEMTAVKRRLSVWWIACGAPENEGRRLEAV